LELRETAAQRVEVAVSEGQRGTILERLDPSHGREAGEEIEQGACEVSRVQKGARVLAAFLIDI